MSKARYEKDRVKRRATIFFTLLLMGGRLAWSQGFVDLNFENAQIIPLASSPYYPYGMATSNALPGWNASIGGSQVTEITYDDPALGSTWINLCATNGTQLSGNYSVLLQGGLTASNASISQTALVPGGAEAILFEAQGTGVGTLVVSLGGQNLSLFALSSGANYTLYGANISTFAGETEQLTFSALGVSSGFNNWNIDDIQFSASTVPEPGVMGLLGLGGLLFGLCRWKNRR